MGCLGTVGTSFSGSSPSRVPGQERRGPPTPGENLVRTRGWGWGYGEQKISSGIKKWKVESALSLSS